MLAGVADTLANVTPTLTISLMPANSSLTMLGPLPAGLVSRRTALEAADVDPMSPIRDWESLTVEIGAGA